MIDPSPEQAKVETMFPAVAGYVRGCGHVEIGDQEGFGFVVRAIGHGGLDFEAGLARWFDEQGVGLE
jgi:hypothetical protein